MEGRARTADVIVEQWSVKYLLSGARQICKYRTRLVLTTGHSLASIQETITLRLDDLVTPAAGRFQAPAIENGDHSTVVTDEFLFLESTSRSIYSFAPNPQHVGHKVLRQTKFD